MRTPPSRRGRAAAANGECAASRPLPETAPSGPEEQGPQGGSEAEGQHGHRTTPRRHTHRLGQATPQAKRLQIRSAPTDVQHLVVRDPLIGGHGWLLVGEETAMYYVSTACTSVARPRMVRMRIVAV